MSESIHSILPDPDALLALEPEEVGGFLLQYLNSLPENEQKHLNFYNYSSSHFVQDYPQTHREKIQYAFMEGAIWLENEGLIAPRPESPSRDFFFITKRGRKLLNADKVKAYRKSNVLPKWFLHPKITEKVWSLYLRGDYDTAVFQSFKEVEIAVRKAGNFEDTDIGVDLMRKAFNTTHGSLTNSQDPEPERLAVGHLFAGAIGFYRNTSGHRDVLVNNPQKAAEIIIFASHLLGIVDERTSSSTS